MRRVRVIHLATVVAAGLLFSSPFPSFEAEAQTALATGVPPGGASIQAVAVENDGAPPALNPGEAASLAMARAILTATLERSNPPPAAVLGAAETSVVEPRAALAIAEPHIASVAGESADTSLRDLVARHAVEAGIPVPLANAVVMIESRYRPHSAHGGAVGLMQIKPQTARGVGFNGTTAGLYDPDVNLTFGMKYLAAAYHQAHGDLCATLMRYQSGLMTSHPSAANHAYCSKARAIMAKA